MVSEDADAFNTSKWSKHTSQDNNMFPVIQELAAGHHHWDPLGDGLLCDGQHCLLHCDDPCWLAVFSSCCCGKRGTWWVRCDESRIVLVDLTIDVSLIFSLIFWAFFTAKNHFPLISSSIVHILDTDISPKSAVTTHPASCLYRYQLTLVNHPIHYTKTIGWKFETLFLIFFFNVFVVSVSVGLCSSALPLLHWGLSLYFLCLPRPSETESFTPCHGSFPSLLPSPHSAPPTEAALQRAGTR